MTFIIEVSVFTHIFLKATMLPYQSYISYKRSTMSSKLFPGTSQLYIFALRELHVHGVTERSHHTATGDLV